MSNILGIKRQRKIRRKLKNVNKNRYRLSIHRTSKNISAQIIDDIKNITLVSATSVEKKSKQKIKKNDLSLHIAEVLAKKALDKKITSVYFDRGKYKFHGRVKSFAETLRKKGLNF
tara:strand:- start:587 stop:934 length:348 start_codon:yes stop_codon:yes gene_type:complete